MELWGFENGNQDLRRDGLFQRIPACEGNPGFSDLGAAVSLRDWLLSCDSRTTIVAATDVGATPTQPTLAQCGLTWVNFGTSVEELATRVRNLALGTLPVFTPGTTSQAVLQQLNRDPGFHLAPDDSVCTTQVGDRTAMILRRHTWSQRFGVSAVAPTRILPMTESTLRLLAYLHSPVVSDNWYADWGMVRGPQSGPIPAGQHWIVTPFDLNTEEGRTSLSRLLAEARAVRGQRTWDAPLTTTPRAPEGFTGRSELLLQLASQVSEEDLSQIQSRLDGYSRQAATNKVWDLVTPANLLIAGVTTLALANFWHHGVIHHPIKSLGNFLRGVIDFFRPPPPPPSDGGNPLSPFDQRRASNGAREIDLDPPRNTDCPETDPTCHEPRGRGSRGTSPSETHDTTNTNRIATLVRAASTLATASLSATAERVRNTGRSLGGQLVIGAALVAGVVRSAAPIAAQLGALWEARVGMATGLFMIVDPNNPHPFNISHSPEEI